jgi:hypothetical protein
MNQNAHTIDHISHAMDHTSHTMDHNAHAMDHNSHAMDHNAHAMDHNSRAMVLLKRAHHLVEVPVASVGVRRKAFKQGKHQVWAQSVYTSWSGQLKADTWSGLNTITHHGPQFTHHGPPYTRHKAFKQGRHQVRTDAN